MGFAEALARIGDALIMKEVYREEGTREDRLMKRVFLSPAVSVLLLLSIFPLLWSLTISFTDIQRGASAKTRSEASEGSKGFLGLGFNMSVRNFGRMPSDQRLHTAARNTLYFVVVGVTLQYVIGLCLALVLNQKFAGRNIARVIFMMPMMMTPVAVAYTGRMMFDTSLSPLADLLRNLSTLLGAEEPFIIPWLTTSLWAPFTIVLIDTWQWAPFMMLLLLAGMQAIPDEIKEAARVDGASPIAIFRKITFPMLLPISVTHSDPWTGDFQDHRCDRRYDGRRSGFSHRIAYDVHLQDRPHLWQLWLRCCHLVRSSGIGHPLHHAVFDFGLGFHQTKGLGG